MITKDIEDPTDICRGCAHVAGQLGIVLSRPHRSCRKVSVTNIVMAAERLDVTVAGLLA